MGRHKTMFPEFLLNNYKVLSTQIQPLALILKRAPFSTYREIFAQQLQGAPVPRSILWLSSETSTLALGGIYRVVPYRNMSDFIRGLASRISNQCYMPIPVPKGIH